MPAFKKQTTAQHAINDSSEVAAFERLRAIATSELSMTELTALNPATRQHEPYRIGAPNEVRLISVMRLGDVLHGRFLGKWRDAKPPDHLVLGQ